ncbi:MAG: HD domain-containing protein, partial [Desulfobacteraceae bacterium]|nr:HD domain-containing protein [Desulfobacteraceae bacterium]
IAIDKDSWLLELIDCPEVQRLRYVSQLGLAHFTYPGSTHSRFSHSLGVLHLMQECTAHLKQEYPKYFKCRQLDEEALLGAALLHDIGHCPLSHATEEILGNHEDRATEIIANSDSNIYKVLSKRAKTLPSKVSALIAKKSVGPLWQKSLISSQLDMDRLDYLRRDSLYSGAEYGNFDWFRIIRTMQLGTEEKQEDIFVVWPDKSKYALEEYIFSRFYMYQSVYFHHTTRGYECLLRKILQRARDIARQNKNFAKGLLTPMKILLDGREKKDIAKFQKLVDHVLLAQITIWRDDKDKILNDLANRLLLREGFAWDKLAPNRTPMEMHNKIEKIEQYLDKQGLDHNYYFFEDQAPAKLYKPYRPAAEVEDQSSVNSIMLYDDSWKETGFKEISDVPGLQRLKAITGDKPSPTMRYYFPKEHERKIKKLLK